MSSGYLPMTSRDMLEYQNSVYGAEWGPLSPPYGGHNAGVVPNRLFSSSQGPEAFSAATCDLEELPLWTQPFNDASTGEETGEYPQDNLPTTASRGPFPQSSTGPIMTAPVVSTAGEPAKVGLTPHPPVPTALSANPPLPLHAPPVRKAPRRKANKTRPTGELRFIACDGKTNPRAPSASSSSNGAVSHSSYTTSPSPASPGGSSSDQGAFSSQYTGYSDAPPPLDSPPSSPSSTSSSRASSGPFDYPCPAEGCAFLGRLYLLMKHLKEEHGCQGVCPCGEECECGAVLTRKEKLPAHRKTLKHWKLMRERGGVALERAEGGSVKVANAEGSMRKGGGVDRTQKRRGKKTRQARQ